MEESSREPPSSGPSRKNKRNSLVSNAVTSGRSCRASAPPIMNSDVPSSRRGDEPAIEMKMSCNESECSFETEARVLQEDHNHVYNARQWKRRTALSTLAIMATAALMLHSSHNYTTKRRTTRHLKKKSGNAASTSSCNSNSPWHVSTDPNQFDTCTNSLDYPSDWDRDDLKDLMLFNSRKKCCVALEQMMPGVSCKTVDVCVAGGTEWTAVVDDSTNGPSASSSTTSTTTTTATKAMKTTTTTTTKFPPSKRVFYPSPQNNLCLSSTSSQIISTISIQFHFSTPEECCSSGYLPYDTCLSRTVQLLYDAVPTTPEPSMAPHTDYPTWSPTQYECSIFHTVWHMNTERLFSCTNSGIYPQEWDVESDIHLFSSASECCLGKFPGLACTKIDVCAPTSSPSKRPTVRPTNFPTKRPTLHPGTTGSPTEAPVYYTRGTCNDEMYWHLSRSEEGTCTNDDDFPETWRHETLARYFLSETPEGCCEMNYFGKYGREREVFCVFGCLC
jgi:hypothetical protein